MNDVSLAEATMDQIAAEVHARSRDFLIVTQGEDGSHGQHSHIYFGYAYAALGLANFARMFIENRMMSDGSLEED